MPAEAEVTELPEATLTDAEAEWVADATVHERVSAILGRLPAIGKDTRNPQQNFMYRSHDAVLNALNPLLAAYGVFMVPHVVERTTEQRTTRQGGIMYEVNLHVEYTFFGVKGDSFVASAWGEGTDSGDKSTNKAMTMAFKNVIAQVFAVSTSDTIDADAGHPEETTGRTGRQEGEQRREFDPGTDLLPSALRGGQDFVQRLGEQLDAIDPTVDWASTLKPVLESRWGVSARADLGDATPEYWRRMSNFAAKMDVRDGDFPPPGDEKIKEALAWAFGVDGSMITVQVTEAVQQAEDALSEEAARAADDDIPFGEPSDPPASDAETS